MRGVLYNIIPEVVTDDAEEAVVFVAQVTANEMTELCASSHISLDNWRSATLQKDAAVLFARSVHHFTRKAVKVTALLANSTTASQ